MISGTSPEKSLRVLLVAGYGRSGSTVLANILGQSPGVFAAGELNWLWEHNILRGAVCACGEPLTRCVVWQPILAGVSAGNIADVARRMVMLQHRGARSRHGVLLFLRRDRKRLPKRMQGWLAQSEELYAAIGRVTACRVVVDTSKSPTYAALLSRSVRLDVCVVHLVRDPRATAYSWRRKLQANPGSSRPTYLPRVSTGYSGVLWTVWNLLTPKLLPVDTPYLTLRYEDFVTAPSRAVESVLALAGEASAVLPFVGSHTFHPKPNHMIAGNPIRFRSGPVELRLDDEWEHAMPRRDRWLVTVLTLPLLRHFGYRLTAGGVKAKQVGRS